MASCRPSAFATAAVSAIVVPTLVVCRPSIVARTIVPPRVVPAIVRGLRSKKLPVPSGTTSSPFFVSW